MKNLKWHRFIIYLFSFLLMGGLLFYPLFSYEAVPKDSTASGFKPTVSDTQIQCKKISINNTKYPSVLQTATQNNLFPACGFGYVPFGFKVDALPPPNKVTEYDWVVDIEGWGMNIHTIRPEYIEGEINQVSVVCVPRELEFSSGPCTK